VRPEHADELVTQRGTEGDRVIELLACHPARERFHDRCGGGHADVGRQEGGLELLEHRGVDLLATEEEAADALEELSAGPGERLGESALESLPEAALLSLIRPRHSHTSQ
jgi:hypothetical protein